MTQDDGARIEAARAGFVDAWRLMADTLPHGAWTEHDGLTIAATGLQIASCNPVMATRTPVDPHGALACARAFYAEHGVPWMLYAEGETSVALEPAAAAAGLTRGDPDPALILVPETSAPPHLPAGLEIEIVRDITAMQTFSATAAAGFETTPDTLAIWANPDLIDTPGLAFFLGRVDGVPVSTSALYALHGIGTVNMVSTIPPYRRRGLAEAMTRHAAMSGFQQGCTASYLHATEMGESFYLRMGYRPIVTYQTWTS